MTGRDPLAAPRVLVIDDTESIHHDFRKILGAERTRPAAPTAAEIALFGASAPQSAAIEFQIETAFQGEEGCARVAQALAEGRPYALAFVDMRMPPGWDGVETTLRIWEADPDVQIVICTAYSDYSWSDMLAKLGRSDQMLILKKPFEPVEVMQLATALTEKWRLGKEARATLEELERRVIDRTRALAQAADRFRDSETQYRLLFDRNPNPMWVYDKETLRFVLVNAAALARYGYSREELLGMTVQDIRPLEDALQDAGEALDTGTGFREMRHCTRDRTMLTVEVSSDEAIFDGRPARLVLAHDVTQRKRGEDRINRLNRVHAMLSAINSLIVRAVDRDELFREACDIAVEHGLFRMAWIGTIAPGAVVVTPIAWAGYAREFLESARLGLTEAAPGGLGHCGKAVRDLVATAANDVRLDPGILRKQEFAALGIVSGALIPLVVDATAVGVFALYSSEADFFDDDEMRLLQELGNDISFAVDHIAKLERLHYLANFDVLTGLANRNQFLGRLAQWMRAAADGGRKLAVYLVDIERFKNINDTLGEPAGDALLRQVGAWLSSFALDGARVARIGPDQFAVAVPEVADAGEIARTVEKVIGDFARHPFQLGDSVFRIAAKSGVAVYPDDGLDADVLLKNAEAALKKAKGRGDRYLFFTQKMTDMVAGKFSLENQMRQALDRGEFVLHYQPKVCAVSGRLTGAEALIRWFDPRSGSLVPPMRFIPSLEETGLIFDVGRWALRQALADHLVWRDQAQRSIPIAVNVSPLQLRNRDFVGEIAAVTQADPEGAAGLELEITESVIMDDAELSIATLKAIRLMGVTVAIDDFGTGYSSLSYLAKLPVDTLKVDRSFVNAITKPEGHALVSTIVRLAHSLKLKVVAEGVETEEQAALLRSLGCDQLQGYLFGKPVAASEFYARYLAATPASATGT